MGLVFNIQRFSLSDGPGIRTTVFLLGCSLKCQWCHNPEGLSGRRLQYIDSKCIGCTNCEQVCPQHAHLLGEQHDVKFQDCIACGKCVEACPSKALRIVGQNYTPSQLTDQLLKDLDYYGENGGITFSGGEPLLQADFVAQTAQICKQRGIKSVAVDTCGNVDWNNIVKVAPHVDLFLYDIKAAQGDLHQIGTSQDNKLILQNLRKLDELNVPIWIRVPVIGGFNDTDEEMNAIADIVNKLKNVQKVTLIPFHILGQEKYSSLGLTNTMCKFHTVDDELIKKYRKYFILEE